MNIMQTAQGQVGNLGAAVVALGNDGASTESEILDMALGIAGAGNIVGFSEAQVLSYANALSSVGIAAEAGGSSVSRVMLDIGEAVDTGGDKLQGFANVAGMSTADFQRAFEDDAAGAVATFIEGLARVNESGGNVTGTLRELGFSEIRVRRALLALAGAGDLLTDSLDLGNKAVEDGTALNDEFAKRMDTNRKKIDQAKAQLNDLAITIGATVLPVMGAMAEVGTTVFGGLADAIDVLPGPLQAAAVGVAGLTAAVTVLGGAVLLMLPHLALAKAEMTRMGWTAKLTAARVGTLRLAMLGMPWAAFAAGAGITYLGLRQLGEETARTTSQLNGFSNVVGGDLTARGARRLDEYKSSMDRVKESTDALGLSHTHMMDIQARLKDELLETTGNASAAAASQDEYQKALAAVLDEYGKLHPEVRKAVRETGAVEETTDRATKSLLKLSGTRDEMQSWRDETVLSLGSVTGRFERLRDKGKLTATDIAGGFEDMLAAQRDFRKNWAAVAVVWGKDTDDIAQFISERMGVDVPTAMNILAEADRATLRSIKQDYREWKREANQTANSLTGDFERIGGKVRGVADDVANLGTQLHKLPSGVQIDVRATGTQLGDGPGRMAGGLAATWAQHAINAVPGPQYITNTYRTPAHNAAVGGSATSYHMDRSNPAADIGGSNLWGIYNYLTRFPTRELIHEGDHVHVADEGGVFKGPGVVRMGKGYETFASGLRPAQRVALTPAAHGANRVNHFTIYADSTTDGNALARIIRSEIDDHSRYEESRARVNR